MNGLQRAAASWWLVAALLVAGLLVPAIPAQAFEPAVMSAEDLFAPASIAVVLGRFEASTAEPAIFIVEKSLRSEVPPGRYAVFESGRFGSRGEPAVYAMSRPSPDAPGQVLLPVAEIDRANARLIVPMATGWRFRVVGGQVRDLMGFSTGLESFAQALRNGGNLPTWDAVRP